MHDKTGRGKQVRLYFDIWYEEGDGAIHITAPGIDYGFHTTVNDNPKSIRCHISLYDYQLNSGSGSRWLQFYLHTENCGGKASNNKLNCM